MGETLTEIQLKDLSQLVYLDIEDSFGRNTELSKFYDINKKQITIGDLIDYYTGTGAFNGDNEGIEKLHERYPTNYQQIEDFLHSLESYRNMQISNVRSHNQKDESGFVAFTVRPDPDKYPNKLAVVFRGSEPLDDPLYRNDWKNNASTTYSLQTWQQADAEQYIKEYIEPLVNKGKIDELYLAGHSLGGNLALFSSFILSDKLREKLVTATTFNAPGFFQGVLEYYQQNIEKMRAEGKIREFQNRKDYVSPILKNPSKGIIIQSANIDDPHSLFDLAVENGKLMLDPSQSRTPLSKLIENITNNFASLPGFMKSGFIDTVFKVWDWRRLSIQDTPQIIASLFGTVKLAPPLIAASVIQTICSAEMLQYVAQEIMPYIHKGRDYVISHIESFCAQMKDNIQKVISDIKDVAKLAGKELLEFKDTVSRAVSSFLTSLEDSVNRFVQYTLDTIDKAREKFRNIKDQVTQKIDNITDSVVTTIIEQKNAFISTLEDYKEKVVNWSGEIKDQAMQEFRNLVETTEEVGESVKDGINRVTTYSREQINRVQEKLRDVKEQVTGKMNSIVSSVITDIQNEKDAFIATVTGYKEKMTQLGSEIKTKASKKIKSFVQGISSAIHGPKILANLDKLQGLQKNLERKRENIGEIVRRILSEASRVLSDVGRNYPERYVQSQIREIEHLLDQIRKESRQVDEILKSKSDGVKNSVSLYRDTEAHIYRTMRA